MHVAQHAARHFQAPRGGAVHHIIEGGERLAKVVAEAYAIGVQSAEHEFAIHLDCARPAQSQPGLRRLKACAVIALAQGNVLQRAVGAESPRVIGAANEFTEIARPLAHQSNTLVRAAIDQYRDAAVDAANHDNRLSPPGGREIGPRAGHLTGMTYIYPARPKQPRHFEAEDLGVGINGPMNLVISNQRAQVGAVPSHG